MSLRYLLDTNICIYIAKNHPEEVSARFQKLKPGAAAMSAVTFGELEYGASKSLYRSDVQKILNELISVIPVVAIDAKVGKRYGEIRAQLEKSGCVIGNNDLWIAAHALALGIKLVTNNEKEFRRVPGLAIQNWISGNSTSKVHEKHARYLKMAAGRNRL